ncbi:hypothetical protein ACN077_25940 [Clostridium chromiireducens]|uniref:Uncharacterized protein n=1 Tax=Clostridium chromiireducens TaxID=225345 RepID=A0A964RQ14_9CLOT|nr:hypothetical protein [Clostridium chromiireducens]MVX65652.1 hypothetical protein [Clostridium chromiireducens]
MKRFILASIFFTILIFNIFDIPSVAETKILRRGFYRIENLNLEQNTIYTIQNTSFNEHIYIVIIDNNQNLVQAIRLWPQSQKFNLVPLQSGYKIVVTGDGDLTITK